MNDEILQREETAPERRGAPGVLWRVATSPVTFVVLSLLWCLDLAIGSILAYRRDPQFWMKMDAYPFNVWLERVAPSLFPGSLWVYILVGLTYLVIASLLLCTLNWFFRRRRRMRGMAEVLIHLGFLLVFTGFVLGSGFGSRSQGIGVAPGGTEEVPGQGLHLRVDGVEVVRGPDGQTLDTVSRVTLLGPGSAVSSGTVRTNHPLIRGETVVYPEGTEATLQGVRVSADGRGPLVLGPDADVELPDGRRLSLVGALQPGQRYGPWLGPGALLGLFGPGGIRLASAYVSPAPGMPTAAELAGVRVRLLGLLEETRGVYNVHHDPGVRFVLAGAVILALGTVWALIGYLRNMPPGERARRGSSGDPHDEPQDAEGGDGGGPGSRPG